METFRINWTLLMRLSTDTLGPYETLAPLGAGGMGEAYRARGARLDRIVAIKISKIGRLNFIDELRRRAPFR